MTEDEKLLLKLNGTIITVDPSGTSDITIGTSEVPFLLIVSHKKVMTPGTYIILANPAMLTGAIDGMRVKLTPLSGADEQVVRFWHTRSSNPFSLKPNRRYRIEILPKAS